MVCAVTGRAIGTVRIPPTAWRKYPDAARAAAVQRSVVELAAAAIRAGGYPDDRADLLRDALLALEPADRDTISRWARGETHGELAGGLGITTGSLNQRVQQILSKLSHLAGGRRRRPKRIRLKSLTASMISIQLEELPRPIGSVG